MDILVLEESPPPPAPGYEYVFRASFWHWGMRRRLYARAYGLSAFRLMVRIGGPRRIPPDRVGVKPGAAPKRPCPKTIRK